MVTSRMSDVELIADTPPEPDAKKSTVTFDYEAMLAALNAVLVEMREERRQVEAAGSFVDVQQGQERATVQPNAWVEAHAMLSEFGPVRKGQHPG